MRLEKAINPLLDDDDQVALSYIILSVIKRMVTIENVSVSVDRCLCVVGLSLVYADVWLSDYWFMLMYGYRFIDLC